MHSSLKNRIDLNKRRKGRGAFQMTWRKSGVKWECTWLYNGGGVETYMMLACVGNCNRWLQNKNVLSKVNPGIDFKPLGNVSPGC